MVNSCPTMPVNSLIKVCSMLLPSMVVIKRTMCPPACLTLLAYIFGRLRQFPSTSQLERIEFQRVPQDHGPALPGQTRHLVQLGLFLIAQPQRYHIVPRVFLHASHGHLLARGHLPGYGLYIFSRAWAISAGLAATLIPHSSSTATFSAAVPLPPEMIAPACPIRFPGGAVRPAMYAATGLVMCSRAKYAASSSEFPPISPIMITASVSGSSSNIRRQSR